MSRYVVRIIGPAGLETFLARGREVSYQHQATHYPHPSNAEQAATAYRAKRQSETFTYDVMDTRGEPEGSCGNWGW
jgi:hypothetical protein